MKTKTIEIVKTVFWVAAFFATLQFCSGCATTLPWTLGEKTAMWSAVGFKTADLIVTHKNLSEGGTEHNPVMRGSDSKRISISIAATGITWAIANSCKTRECRSAMLWMSNIFNVVPLWYSLSH